MKKATPQLKEILDIVDMMVKAGVLFVPVPVFNDKEFDELLMLMMKKVAEIDAPASINEEK